jgi:hypothetical protein
MLTFKPNQSYNEYNGNGKSYKILCTKVTKQTATFDTVYGIKRFKINRTNQPNMETVNTNYGTTIEAI